MGTSVPEGNEGRKQRLWTCTFGKIGSSVFRRDDFRFCKEWRILDKGKGHITGAEAPIFGDRLGG